MSRDLAIPSFPKTSHANPCSENRKGDFSNGYSLFREDFGLDIKKKKERKKKAKLNKLKLQNKNKKPIPTF